MNGLELFGTAILIIVICIGIYVAAEKDFRK